MPMPECLPAKHTKETKNFKKFSFFVLRVCFVGNTRFVFHHRQLGLKLYVLVYL